jgi:hypothetical protein
MIELEQVGISPVTIELIERIDAQREVLAATVAHVAARQRRARRSARRSR